jgi:flagellin-like hook-associated protein FlgL
MSDIVLSAGVRQNLLSLQSTAQLMSLTQNRLATGKKVNTALDNPVNFFTAASLQSRANDLSALLDSMSNGIKTLEAADNALTSITSTVQSMQSTLRQARQDRSFKTQSYTVALATPPAGTEQISFSGGSVGATAVNVGLTAISGTTPGTNAVVTGTSVLAALNLAGTPATNAALTGTSALGSIDTTIDTNAIATGTSPLAPVDASLGDITFEVNGELVTLDDAFAGTGGTGIYSAAEVRDAINTQVGVSAGVNATLDTRGNLVITSTGTAGAQD